MGSHYEVLGISEKATPAEIKAAFRTRVRLLHPDHVPEGDTALQAEATRMMVELNEAYKALSDPEERLIYDQSATGGGPSRSGRYPASNECVMCASFPARDVVILQISGRIIGWTGVRLGANLCRSCGLAEFRHLTNRTMIFGWWGIFAIYYNTIVIARNVYARWRLQSLGPPQILSDANEVFRPLQAPLDPGPSLFRRLGFWFASVGLTMVIIAAAVSDKNKSKETPKLLIDESVVGKCVSVNAVGTLTGFVGCELAHDGLVISYVNLPQDCPTTADIYFSKQTETGSICVDTQR